jgi:ribosomal-protein-alanine N-acetyltransferase
VLRPPRTDDVAILYQALRRNVEHLGPWTPTPPLDERRPTLTAVAREIARWRSLWRKSDSYAFYVWPREAENGSITGRVTLGRVTRGAFQNAYLGYWMDRDLQGRGYMTEAVRAATTFAFTVLQLHRVQAAIMPRNVASIRVAEKCGFRREGFALRYLEIAGTWEDHELYAVTREEWR